MALAGTSSADCLDPFAAPGEVLDFHLRLSRPQWDALRTPLKATTSCELSYPWHQVQWRCGDGSDWLTVGLRHKRGDQRGVDAPQKPPLKLDFNRFVPQQQWPSAMQKRGYAKLSLNNGQANQAGGALPALLTEGAAWRLLRDVSPAVSRTAYARLLVHFSDEAEAVEDHGVYLVLEDLDRAAMRRRSASACGALLKSTTVWCREQVEFDDGPPDEARAAYDRWYEADPGAEGWLDRSREALALDDLLRQEATRDLLAGEGDSPLGPTYNNYFRFEPRQGRVAFFPWDVDLLFGPFPQVVAPTTPLERDCSPLGAKTRCHPAIAARYAATLCDLTHAELSPERVGALLEELDRTLRPLIPLERPLIWPQVDPLDATLPGSYQAELERLRAWYPARVASVRAQLTARGSRCPSGCAEGTRQLCARATCLGARRCVAGRWSECAVRRAEEACNGLDDDCDGEVDEGCPSAAEACDKATPAPRRQLSQCGCSAGQGGAVLPAALWWWRRRRARQPGPGRGGRQLRPAASP